MTLVYLLIAIVEIVLRYFFSIPGQFHQLHREVQPHTLVQIFVVKELYGVSHFYLGECFNLFMILFTMIS